MMSADPLDLFEANFSQAHLLLFASLSVGMYRFLSRYLFFLIGVN